MTPVEPFDENSCSLVLGGPLYGIYLRSHLLRSPMDLVRRRIAAMVAICWFPLLLLVWLQGAAVDAGGIPFAEDLSVHCGLLVALPLFIGAEAVVHSRIPKIVRQFFERGLVTGPECARVQALVVSTLRLRNSVVVEICLLAAVFTLGHWVWSYGSANGLRGWYGSVADGKVTLTPAGYWYALVSLPILRFLLLRWYFRLFLWYRFLWRMQTVPMQLNLLHPDREAGLGFLAGSMFAFAPVLIAQTAALAGIVGNRIVHMGAKLSTFEAEALAAVLFLILIVMAPLGFFAGRLIEARRTARSELGLLASRYVDDFRRKWIQSEPPLDGPLLGSPDIQSLADLDTAFATVNEMRILPFTAKAVLRLAIVVSAPLAPLTLAIVPFERVMGGILKLLL